MSLQTEENQSRPYFPHLDGLRFFAFLFVFVSHIARFVWERALFLTQGDLGVSFFFVLSGFLITYLLLFEKENGGIIHLPKFYLRRILRIWPLYFIVFGIGILFAQLALPHVPFITNFNSSATIWYVSFLANFWIIAHRGISTILVVLWSISVEEQFYLVWPLIMKFIKKRFIPVILCSLVLIAIIYRYLNWENYKMVDYSTFSVMSDLAIGALLGFFSFYIPHFRDKMAKYLTRAKVLSIYALFVGLFLLKIYAYAIVPDGLRPLYGAILPILFSIVFALIIFEQNYSEHSFFKASTSRALVYLGKISYGLYVYHIIAISLVFYFLAEIGIHSKFLITILSFGLTVLMAHLSYKYIEQKILRLKDRMR
jgi:peptidoglycan/LPS O-acetylase OafA/YrhL